MSTTSLFVEILIIGLEVLVWLGLIVGIIWEPSPFLEFLKEYEQYSALITTFVLGLAYVAGIIFDRLADSFYKIIRYNSKIHLPDKIGNMRLRIMHESEGMAKFLDYQRSRLRIARATFLNLFITFFVAVIWLGQTDIIGLSYVVLVGITVLALTLYSTRRIDKAQIERLDQAYKILTGK